MNDLANLARPAAPTLRAPSGSIVPDELPSTAKTGERATQ